MEQGVEDAGCRVFSLALSVQPDSDMDILRTPHGSHDGGEQSRSRTPARRVEARLCFVQKCVSLVLTISGPHSPFGANLLGPRVNLCPRNESVVLNHIYIRIYIDYIYPT